MRRSARRNALRGIRARPEGAGRKRSGQGRIGPGAIGRLDCTAVGRRSRRIACAAVGERSRNGPEGFGERSARRLGRIQRADCGAAWKNPGSGSRGGLEEFRGAVVLSAVRRVRRRLSHRAPSLRGPRDEPGEKTATKPGGNRGGKSGGFACLCSEETREIAAKNRTCDAGSGSLRDRGRRIGSCDQGFCRRIVERRRHRAVDGRAICVTTSNFCSYLPFFVPVVLRLSSCAGRAGGCLGFRAPSNRRTASWRRAAEREGAPLGWEDVRPRTPRKPSLFE